ncbi:MAG TPA: condensation domain-containing protein, partial [Vicinamibacterales bacterium]
MTEVVDSYPLSPLQHGMLFHHLQGGRETGVDVEQLDAKLHEPIDAATLTRAWAAVADRHAILRTRFRWEGLDAPRQEVVASVSAPVEWRDISHLSSGDQAATLASFLRDDRRRGFDLGEAPLWRVTTFRLADDEYRMVWTYSHAILDSCYAEVLREVFAAYEALRQNGRPHFDERPAYRDHISWLQGDLHARARQIQAFWRERLAGFTTPTNLEAVQIPASDRAAAEHQTAHDVVRFKLSAETSDTIRRSAVEFDLRVSVFVEAAWALVLGAFTGEEDVVFGTTRACRRSSIPRADAILGLFINTLPTRAAIPPDKPLIALLRELRADQIALRSFEHTPLVDVVASAGIARGAPLFETIVVFNDMDNDARFKSFGGAWAARDFELLDQTNFPLNVMAYDGPEISFKLSYERRRFARDTVERIASLLAALL